MRMIVRACVLALLLAWTARAGAAGRFEGFAGAWAPEIGGTLQRGTTTFDLGKTLALDASPSREFFLFYSPQSHWYWPDLSASFSHLGAQGNGMSDGTVRLFGLLPIPANSQLFSTVSINDYDVSADVPFDLWHLHFGAGVTMKYLVGNVTVNTLSTGSLAGVPLGSVSGTSLNRVDEVFPLVHLRAAADLASWLSLVVAGNYVQYGGDRAYELRGVVDLRPLDPVTLSLGYLRKSYRVNDSGYLLDTTVDGLYFGVGLIIR